MDGKSKTFKASQENQFCLKKINDFYHSHFTL